MQALREADINKQEAARKLADRLLGTCENYELEHPLYDDLEFCEELDAVVRRCETCDWWVETSEIDGNSNCEECRHEQQ